MEEDPTLEVQGSSSKDSMSPSPSPARGPSSDFLKRRHERMRGRTAKKEEEDTADHLSTESTASMESSKGLTVDTTSEDSAMSNSESHSFASTASPTALRSFKQFREKRKSRVPGGAAAKLIGKAAAVEPIEEEYDEANGDSKDEDEPVDVPVPTDEFIRMRDEAKAAFAVGNKDNRRYHTVVASDASVESVSASVETHKVLNRNEAYHEDATASVLSLLNRSETPKVISTGPVPSIGSSVSPSKSQDFTQSPAMESTPRNAFQAPPRVEESASVVSNLSTGGRSHHTTSGNTSGAVLPAEELETTLRGKNPLEQPLLSKKAEERVAQMKKQMKDPDAKLSDLIASIASPEGHSFTRGYMVRRKNACGALQVLTAKNTHRIQICWTVGVLPALSSVLADSGNAPLNEVIEDVHTRREFIEARKRAVSALMNLAMPQENRLAVFHTPQLISNVVRVIRLDHEEARKGCCAVLAHLAKTKENRLLMVQVPGLIDAITSVVEPKAFDAPTTQYSDEVDDDDATYDSNNSSVTPDHEYPLHSPSTNDESTDGRKRVGSSFSDSEYLGNSASFDSNAGRRKKQTVQTASRRYDTDPNTHLHGSRVNVFALFSHLVKEKDNAYILARHAYLMETLVAISKLHESSAHAHAIRILANLTRHRGNSKHIVFKIKTVVPAIVKASFSQNDDARKHACFALQNLAQDKPCRQELAITDGLLSAVCVRIRQASDPEERLSAIHTIKNLTDEPANLIPMTNTSECFATLMQIAHASDDSVSEMMQYLGCDALATLSHWFRSIATSGQRIEAAKKGLKPTRDLYVPSLQIVTFEQWK